MEFPPLIVAQRRSRTSHVGALEVCTDQDRSRGIGRAGQKSFWTPEKELMTDQKHVAGFSTRGCSAVGVSLETVAVCPAIE